LIGVVGAAAFWSGTTGEQTVLVATREIAAGTRLAPGDVVAARVRLGDPLLRAAIPASEQASLLGRELAEPVHDQQLLHRAHLATSPLLSGELRAMTIPTVPERAAGGLVRLGDAVMVMVTPRAPSDASAEVVLSRATVYTVGYDERTTLGPAGGGQPRRGPITSLTLLVTDAQALQLARARARGDLDVALLPREAPASAPAVAGSGSSQR
jgi:Flp pilus assembly protein CpaB